MPIPAQHSERALLQLPDPLRGQVEFLPDRGEANFASAGQSIAFFEDLPQPRREMSKRLPKMAEFLRMRGGVTGIFLAALAAAALLALARQRAGEHSRLARTLRPFDLRRKSGRRAR